MKKRISILICSLIFCAICFPLNAAAEEITLKHLNIKSKFAYGSAKYDIYGKHHNIPNYGMRFEVLRGFKIPTMPGLEVGIGVSYLQMGNDTSFEVDTNSLPNVTTLGTCKMVTSLTGTILMARYSYNFAIGGLPVGIENGIGIGYFYQRNDWKIKALDGTDLDSDMERVESTKPVLDFGVKVNLLKRQHTSLDIGVNGLWLPVFMEISGTTIQDNIYKMEIIGELGLNWQVTF